MEPKVKSGNSIASFVLGLISVIISPVGPITGIVGLINGIVSRAKKQGKKGLGIAGIVLNSIGIVLGIIVDAIIIFVVIIALTLGLTTVGMVYSAVALFNASGMADILTEDINWSEFNAGDVDGSIKTMMVDYVVDKMMGHYLDELQSEEGMLIVVQGHSYRLFGDSFESIIVVNEETGESSDIKEFLAEFSADIPEIRESLETEYGMSDVEFQVFVYSALEGELDVLGDEAIKEVFGEDADANYQLEDIVSEAIENDENGELELEEWYASTMESGEYAEVPLENIIDSLGEEPSSNIPIEDIMNALGGDYEDIPIEDIINALGGDTNGDIPVEDIINALGGDYEDIPIEDIINALGGDSSGDLQIDDLMDALNGGTQYGTTDPFSTKIEGVDTGYMLKLIIEAILSSDDLDLGIDSDTILKILSEMLGDMN